MAKTPFIFRQARAFCRPAKLKKRGKDSTLKEIKINICLLSRCAKHKNIIIEEIKVDNMGNDFIYKNFDHVFTSSILNF